MFNNCGLRTCNKQTRIYIKENISVSRIGKYKKHHKLRQVNWIFVHLINLLMNFIERFQLFKCTKHA